MSENMNEEAKVIEPEKNISAKRRGRPPKIGKDLFIEMWNKSVNLEEVASLLGISKASCSVRASNLRKGGCNLRQFVRGRKRQPMEEGSA